MATRIYWYEESLSRTTTTTTDYSVVKITKAFLPNANKTYAIFWSVALDNSGDLHFKKARLQNTTGSVTLGECIMESTSTSQSSTNKVLAGALAIYTAPASPATQTIEIQIASSNALTTVGAQEASLFILELIDSVDIWGSSTGVTNISSTTYSTKLELAWTPGSAGDYLVVGSMNLAIGSSDPRGRLNINNGTIDNLHQNQYDGSANNWYPYVGAARMVGITGSNTAWLQHASSAASQTSVREAYAVALRMDQFDAHYWAEDRTPHNSASPTYVDSAATTGAITPAAVPHVVFAIGDTTATDFQTTSTGVKISGAGSDIGTNFIQNYGHSGYWWSYFQVRVVTPSASSQTWVTQYARTAGANTATTDEHVIAFLQLEAEAAGTPQTLAPDAIAASTNLTGAVTAIDEDPDSPDANWLTATSATAVTDVRVTFPTPTGNPIGAQDFKAWLRKTTGAPTPTVDVMLYQGGASVATLLNDTGITSTSGQLVQGNWNASQLTGTLDGSDVECRIVSVTGKTPGAMPAYDGTGQAAAVVTATITTAITPAKPSTVNSGDLLILQVLARNDEGNGAGPASIANWTAFAGNPYGSSGIQGRQSLYWRIAGAGEASQTVSVTCTGSTTADLAMARIYRFTAANGFSATPIEGITTNEAASTSLSAPVTGATPGGTNRRAVCFGAIPTSDATIGNMTGETAGDWTEAVTGNSTTGGDGTLNVQTADASAGTAISGGAITYTVSTGNEWTTVACYLVPSESNTNTVEIGAIEWNAQYTPAGAGQPMSKRWGGIPFAAMIRGVW